MDRTDAQVDRPQYQSFPAATAALNWRGSQSGIRLTLASVLGSGLDGAWWPRSASLARELPQLVDGLREPLGEVIDIGVNWSPLEGVPDLDSLTRRGLAATSTQQTRHHRVMSVVGDRARARILVVPWRTSTALAVMVLREAAALPILPMHVNTAVWQIADGIVRAARTDQAPQPR